jgi:hypothetical protein
MIPKPPDLAPSASPPSQSQAPATLQPASEQEWPRKTKWTIRHTLGLLAIIAATLMLGFVTPRTQMFWAWIGTMILLTGFATVAGHGILGLWRGLLIDERNKMSLSRLQMILWTIVVLSGFLTAAIWNIRAGQVDVLAIAVPQELWLLMGIATTSLIGSPLILSTKMAQNAEGDQEQGGSDDAKKKRVSDGAKKTGRDPNTVTNLGNVVAWQWPKDATWADLFEGEEIGNWTHLDLGKIQMFYFTLILVLTYAAMLGAMFLRNSSLFQANLLLPPVLPPVLPAVPISTLPSLPAGMVALLGISNGGYLGNKAIPHTAGQ